MRAIQVAGPGGPEVLELVDLPEPLPGPGEVIARVNAAGVNFSDIFRRAGQFPSSHPYVPGSEGSGVVTAVGRRVKTIAVGDRIAWTDARGAYAELVPVRADRALRVPEGVPDDVAAALPLQGITAQYLVTSAYPVQSGDKVLIHAGAGGVGLLLTQLAVARGAEVMTTVSTAEKEELSRAAGADAVVRYDELDDISIQLPTLVREWAEEGVSVAYDGVGRTTFDSSLASLRRRGTLVLFGSTSGPVPPFDLRRLTTQGSVSIIRPAIGDYIVTPEELHARAEEVFGAAAAGHLQVRIGARFPLADAAEAHRALESRSTTGKVILEMR